MGEDCTRPLPGRRTTRRSSVPDMAKDGSSLALWRMLTAVVVLALSAGCSTEKSSGSWSTSGTGDESEVRGAMPYTPVDEMEAPMEPPAAEILSGGIRTSPIVVALDWRTIEGGPSHNPAPAVNWPPPLFADSWMLEVHAATRPFRVVMYRYASVGPSGIPEENVGDEIVCDPDRAACLVESAAVPGRIKIQRVSGPLDGYFVVQATWLYVPRALKGSSGPEPLREPSEATISWAFHIGSP